MVLNLLKQLPGAPKNKLNYVCNGVKIFQIINKTTYLESDEYYQILPKS